MHSNAKHKNLSLAIKYSVTICNHRKKFLDAIFSFWVIWNFAVQCAVQQTKVGVTILDILKFFVESYVERLGGPVVKGDFSSA